jgi:hypothetical protein
MVGIRSGKRQICEEMLFSSVAASNLGELYCRMRPFCKEILRFLREEKKWWLIPLLISFLILAALVFFTQGPAPLSPFMYSVK